MHAIDLPLAMVYILTLYNNINHDKMQGKIHGRFLRILLKIYMSRQEKFLDSRIIMCYNVFRTRACSSAGRALRSQRRGRGFDPLQVHHELCQLDTDFAPHFMWGANCFPRSMLFQTGCVSRAGARSSRFSKTEPLFYMFITSDATVGVPRPLVFFQLSCYNISYKIIVS